ncbi:carboxymuconolactone decarboxylase [Actinorhabdospora filicis]|uniref:Carboxymuconolactone decarboxylase n=1 Tax=Actinorhabdospora filicis TaxID=1785913 RepID=A0A9W6SRB5_9ACTN|nr:carboxymuconolactone decarboxylase family protein [Actinorhabdospora filicis]GLZ80550.1 carboxymuconolactone decarboxylase [Actinorhabdospora filicis]
MNRYEEGLERLREVSGEAGPAVLDSLSDIAPGFARLVAEFGYADIYGRPGLNLRQRQLINVAALTAMGTAAPQLRFHADAALHVGVTPEELVEAVLHMAIYAGFPAALNGLAVVREVFAARGVVFEPPAPLEGDRYARGARLLEEVDGHAGTAVVDALADIAPDFARMIIEFSFGEIYARPGLDLKSRELATVGACVALGTARPQLRVHLHGLLNVGGTREEAVETIIQVAGYAGFPAALNGLGVAREVFGERDASQSESRDTSAATD